MKYKNKKILKMLCWFSSFVCICAADWKEKVISSVFVQKCSDFDSTNETNIFEDDFWIVPDSLMVNHFPNANNTLVFRLEKMGENVSWCEKRQIINIEIGEDELSSNGGLSTLPSQSIEFKEMNGTEINNSDNSTFYSTFGNAENSDVSYKPMIHFTRTGMLSIDGEYFRPQEYCIQRISGKEMRVEVCEINCLERNTPCIPICCSIDKVIEHNGTDEKCQPGGSTKYTPTFYKDPYTRLSDQEAKLIQPHFFKTFPNCGDVKMVGWPLRPIHHVPQTSFRLLSNGRVKYLDKDRKWNHLDVDQYCVAGLKNMGEAQHYAGHEEDQIIYTCWFEFTSNEVSAPGFYIPTFFVGSFFLLLTALVYILLWEKQNVHGWTILSFVLSMFFLFIFLGWTHLVDLLHHSWEYQGTFFCKAIGVITHFFFLSTFCWLSVINFDLWWTFKSMTPVAGRSKGFKRFVAYLTFAWGVPAIVIILGILLQTIFSDPKSEVIVPDYGKVNCFLPYTPKGVYLYYIIGFLMMVNLVFMSLTLYTIYKFKEGTRAVDAARSNNTHYLSVRLFVKLFVVMGVSWIFEFLSWWFSVEATVVYWIVFDMFNLFQSLAIFIIFVCKPKIRNQLVQKYPSLKVLSRGLSRRATRTVTFTTSARTTGFSARKINQTQT